MLRLSFTRKDGVNIAYRAHSHRLTKPLLLAFVGALSLHLLPLLLFDIDLFPQIGSSYLFAPAVVQTFNEPMIEREAKGKIQSEIAMEGVDGAIYRAPQPKSLGMPSLVPTIRPERPIQRDEMRIEVGVEEKKGALFLPMEEFKGNGNEAIIIASGPLADAITCGNRFNCLVEKSKPVNSQQKERLDRLSFSVYVDSDSQSVIWYEIKDKPKNRSNVLLAEKALKAMSFPMKKQPFRSFLEGTLEIFLPMEPTT